MQVQNPPVFVEIEAQIPALEASPHLRVDPVGLEAKRSVQTAGAKGVGVDDFVDEMNDFSAAGAVEGGGAWGRAAAVGELALGLIESVFRKMITQSN